MADAALRIAMLGAGSFGTAVAAALARRNHPVELFCRTAAQADAINTTRQNDRYFPGHDLPPTLVATADLDPVLGADVICLSFPAKVTDHYAQALAERARPGAIVMNLVKGLHEKHFAFAELFRQVAPHLRYAAVKGPTFARPLFLGEWSGLTCGADDPATIDEVVALFAGAPIVFDRSNSADSVDVVSALKNVYAIALGLVASTGPSENTIYLSVTLVMREMAAILKSLECDDGVLLTFAGLGDTLLTGLCDTSRNRTLGLMIGKGIPIDLVRSDFLAEGVRAVVALRQHLNGVDTPLLNAVHEVLTGQGTPTTVFRLFQSQ